MFLCRRRTLILQILLGGVVFLAVWFLLRSPDMEPEALMLDEGPYMPLDLKDLPLEGVVLLEGYGSPRLTPRMWCALESAARAHPDTPVSLLMTSKIIKDTFLLHELKEQLPNLQLLHLNAAKLFENTILDHWYREKKWEESYWPKSHFNDVLRWMVLMHYGGIYLDLDVVVLRSLAHLPNCTGLESETWAAAGVLKFTAGHPVVEGCVQRIAEYFDGTVWGANGPELITEVLKNLCGMELPSGNTPLCSDVVVMPPRVFYPIPWWNWKLYVKEDEALARELLSDVSVHVLHVWNLHTRHAHINLESSQPYAYAARSHCPTTVAFEGPFI